jgi:hypothetical protein
MLKFKNGNCSFLLPSASVYYWGGEAKLEIIQKGAEGIILSSKFNIFFET